jgi:hypothetical protein
VRGVGCRRGHRERARERPHRRALHPGRTQHEHAGSLPRLGRVRGLEAATRRAPRRARSVWPPARRCSTSYVSAGRHGREGSSAWGWYAWVDSAKAVRELGYCIVPLPEMLERATSFWRDHSSGGAPSLRSPRANSPTS